MTCNLKNFFLTVWDTEFNALGIADNIISLQWTKQLNEPGNFTLAIPFSNKNISLFKLGNLITKNSLSKDGDLLEPYVITYVNLAINDDGVETLQIQGISLLNWFSQRVISNMDKDIISGRVFDIINEIISKQCIDPEDNSRVIPNLVISENENLLEETTYTITKYSSLLDSISSICQSHYYGIEILMNPKVKNYIVNIFKGEDKSIGISDSPIIFSENLNNIISNSYVESSVNYKNTAYVYGTISSSSNPNGENKEAIIKYPLESSFNGLNRYETSIDCSNPDINGKKITLTNANFNQISEALGYEILSLSEEIKSFSGSLNVRSNLVYGTDFNIGDIVTCLNKDWNLNMNSLIVAVSEEYSVNGLNIVITFGYPLPSIIKKINSIYTRRL